MPQRLSQSEVLRLRKQAVASAEAEFKGVTGRRARHYARLQLVRNRRALQAQQETIDGPHPTGR